MEQIVTVFSCRKCPLVMETMDGPCCDHSYWDSHGDAYANSISCIHENKVEDKCPLKLEKYIIIYTLN